MKLLCNKSKNISSGPFANHSTCSKKNGHSGSCGRAGDKDIFSQGNSPELCDHVVDTWEDDSYLICADCGHKTEKTIENAYSQHFKLTVPSKE